MELDERWRRIKEVFTTVLAVPPAMREAWLAETLPGEPFLADEVRELVAAFDQSEDGLGATPPDLPRELLQTAVVGLRIGPYRILSELGRGGMGAVYLAVRDDEAYQQRVAVKLVKRGMDTDDIVRRFVHERKILAGLAHPNIARLIDGGSTQDGRPYFVMEYVAGRPITVYAQEKKLSVEARLRLFVKVCSAVQFAHQNLIVHRDIKPGNLLLDRDGEPKLLDFGIAKLLAPPAFAGLSELTHAHRQPMTPDYASPEQLAGEPVTTATDVYGLGILLYELLVGQNPVAVGKLLGAGRAERLPSQAVRGLDGDHKLARRLQGDLDTIAGKALEHEPQRRYATAAALAEDVERHLEQRPVKARPPTLRYRLGRTLMRQKLASALMLSVAVFAGIAGYLWYTSERALRLAEEQRLQADEQRRKAEALAGFLKGLFRSSDPQQNRGEKLTVLQILDEGAKQLLAGGERSPSWAPMPGGAAGFDAGTRADLLYEIADVYGNLGLYDQAQKLLESALALREPWRGDRESQLGKAKILTLLGHMTYHQGHYDASRRHYLDSIAIKERQLGPRDPSLADDLNGLGAELIEMKRFQEAAGSLHRAEAIGRQAGPRGRKELAVSLNNLANLEQRQEHLAEARQHYQEALDIDKPLLGADHPDTLSTERNLGSVLLDLGEYAKAEALYQDILQTQERVLGSNHRDLILTLSMLGMAHLNRDHYSAAADSLRRALAMRGQLGLPHNADEAVDLRNYAVALWYQEDLRGAQEYFQKSYQLYLQLEGDHSVAIAQVLDSLSKLKSKIGNTPRR
ncbi:MAG TPA: serine/threonine-protein kinase [Thermoanaerobaculia bacterium]|nr:serine/threonine-protein kinase [Thermoanaerobaculia bacterium]